ncbi:MAG: glycosyltransferase family 4 protein, partial [Patescibacteria group bacterium]
VESYLPITERLARLAGKPYLGTIHGTYGVKPFRAKRQGRIFARAMASATQIICVSHYTKDRLAEFVDATKFVVIPNGIKTAGIVASSPAEISARANLILSVGALKERKAQHLLLAALPTLRQSFPDLKCVLVAGASKGAYGEKIKGLVADSRLGDYVTIKEKISDQELDQLYRVAKVFVLLPVSEADNFEGFGLVYLEANLRAVPVIGAFGSGAEEAIAPEQSGFLVDTNKPEELVRRLKLLLSDSGQYSHLCQSARDWALEHDIDLMAKRYLELFKTIKV